MYRAIAQLKRMLNQSSPPSSSGNVRAVQGPASSNSSQQILSANPIIASASEQTLQPLVHAQEMNSAFIIVDFREKSNPVVKELLALGAEVKMEQLSVGDYLLSKDIVAEFKTVEDFADSIIDGRLLDQAKSLSSAARPLLVIEGTEDIYLQRKIHPNAVRGMLASLALSFRIPIIQTKNQKETAALLFLIAQRESGHPASPGQQHKGKPSTLSQMQEYFVSALPGIGSVLSVPLLSEFKSVQNIANASLDDLQKVELIGEKKAKTIHNIFHAEYLTEKK